MKITRVPQITRAKLSPCGVQWRSPIIVLARHGTKELWKVSGCTRNNRFHSCYVPGYVALVPDAERHWQHYTGDTEDLPKGRVSRAYFARNAEAINAFFGCDLARHLDPKGTVICD